MVRRLLDPRWSAKHGLAAGHHAARSNCATRYPDIHSFVSNEWIRDSPLTRPVGDFYQPGFDQCGLEEVAIEVRRPIVLQREYIRNRKSTQQRADQQAEQERNT